jgi:hypothetical protein
MLPPARRSFGSSQQQYTDTNEPHAKDCVDTAREVLVAVQHALGVIATALGVAASDHSFAALTAAAAERNDDNAGGLPTSMPHTANERQDADKSSCCTANSPEGVDESETTAAVPAEVLRLQTCRLLIEWSGGCRVGDELTLLALSYRGRALVRDIICDELQLSLALRWEGKGSQFAVEPRYQRQLVLQKQPASPRYHAHHVQQYHHW